MPYDHRFYNYAVSFNGISFPLLDFKSALKHSVGHHSYYNRAGDYIEPTGRASREFSLTAIFGNWIEPAANEQFKFGNLYPAVFRELQELITQNPKGTLMHPYLGDITVVCTEFDDTLTPSDLGGVVVQMTMIETIDPDVLESGDTPAGALSRAIVDMDSELQFRKPHLSLPKDTENFNFLDAINRITGFVDNTVMRVQQQLSVIDRTAYHLKRLQNSVKNAKSFADGALNNSINSVLALINQIKLDTANKFQKTIKTMVTANDTTFAQLKNLLSDEAGNNSVGDLVKLNPALTASPLIPANTTIRYYVTTLKPKGPVMS